MTRNGRFPAPVAGVVCCRLGGGSGSLLCEMGGIPKESGAVAGDRSAGDLRGRTGDVLRLFGGGLSADALVCDIQPDPDLYSRAADPSLCQLPDFDGDDWRDHLSGLRGGKLLCL